MPTKTEYGKDDIESIILPDGNQISIENFMRMYESVGVEFYDGKARLKIEDRSVVRSIEIKEDMLFRPKGSDWAALNQEISRILGNQIELFDPADKSHEYVLNGVRYHDIGRVYAYSQIDCCFRERKYYTYLRLVGSEQMSPQDYEKILMYLLCVAGVVGIVVLISLVPGGQIVVSSFVPLIIGLAAGCVAIINGVGSEPQKQSIVQKYVAR